VEWSTQQTRRIVGGWLTGSQRETSLEGRQVFMARPGDEQVEAPTSYGGPLHITGGQKSEGEKCPLDARERHL
jgi:hypothetical protein